MVKCFKDSYEAVKGGFQTDNKNKGVSFIRQDNLDYGSAQEQQQQQRDVAETTLDHSMSG